MVNDQLDAQFFSMYLFQFSTCFEQPRAHHQENQFINTTSGICHCVSVSVSCAGLRHRVTYTRSCIDKLILLMMSTRLLETCRELK